MVKWDYIEDTNPLPTRVWLSRTKNEEDEGVVNNEEWKPLRKSDIKALNNRKSKNQEYGNDPVLIESGRATADPDFGIIRSNFVPRPLRELTSCTWFEVMEEKKDPNSGKLKPVLRPLSDEQSETVEIFYQRAIYAASIYGNGIDPMLKEKVEMEGTQYHVEVCKENGNYLMKNVENGWFSKSFALQRGYGSYISEGEEEEEILGPVGHVILVVHGIGETYFSKDSASSMVKQIDQLRLVFQRRQIADWKKKSEVAKKKKKTIPDPPKRVEFLPILWYDRVHSSSNAMTRSLKNVTLNTIPALRSIANDVVLDVLLYLTPNYCNDVLESVTDQIFSVYGVFNKIFPDFASRGGKFSLIGHSLGSVICWDLLSLKKNLLQNGNNKHGVHVTTSKAAENTANINYQQLSNGGAWGPSLPKIFKKVIPFEPDFTMFIGSPIGLFLSLRGAHPVFDSIRDVHPQQPKVSPFTLPTRAIYNIFSPSDPVAYRIEPLLLTQDTEELPDPVYLTRLGENVRFHIKAMQLGDEIRKKSWSLFGNVSKTSSTGNTSTLNVTMQEKEKDSNEQSNEALKTTKGDVSSDGKNKPLEFPLGGRSNRLDYQLQPGVIDNEYITAVTAHSTYFQNTDIIDFIMDVAGQEEDVVIDLTNDEGAADQLSIKDGEMIVSC